MEAEFYDKLNCFSNHNIISNRKLKKRNTQIVALVPTLTVLSTFCDPIKMKHFKRISQEIGHFPA